MIKWIENTFKLESDWIDITNSGEFYDLLDDNKPTDWNDVSLPIESTILIEHRKVIHWFFDALISIAPAQFLQDFFSLMLGRNDLNAADSQKLHIKYGMFLANNHRFNESIEQFERALKLADDSDSLESADQVMNYLGVVYYRSGELQKALESHEKSLSILSISENNS